MQVTKSLIAAAGNAGGASGALYDFTNNSGTTTLFQARTVRITSNDDIVFHIDRRTNDYAPGIVPAFGKIDQDGNLSFFREFSTSNNSTGWFCNADCMNLDAQNNIHGLVRNTGGFNVGSLKLSGSNGTDLLGFISNSNYNNNQIFGVTSSIPDNQISLCWKQGSQPNSVINMYGAAGNPAYNAFSNRSWVASSLNGQIPNGCAVIPSWTYWNFSTIYSNKYAVFTLWTNASNGAPGYERGINTIADSSYTTQQIYPRITIQDPTDVNDVFCVAWSYDNSSGNNCQNICLIRFDAFYSASDLFRVYGRFAATGENNNIQVDGAVADTVTGDNYMYVSGYYYDTVKALNVSYVICFDGATGDIVNQVRISATGNTQSVFTQGPCSIDSEGNVYTCVAGQTARSSSSSIIKLPPGLAISDTTAGIYDIEEINEFALQGTNSITLNDFSATASGFGFADQGGSNYLTSKAVTVTNTTI